MKLKLQELWDIYYAHDIVYKKLRTEQDNLQQKREDTLQELQILNAGYNNGKDNYDNFELKQKIDIVEKMYNHLDNIATPLDRVIKSAKEFESDLLYLLGEL